MLDCQSSRQSWAILTPCGPTLCAGVSVSARLESDHLNSTPCAGCTAVDDGGKLYAWGRNDAGQLGLGDLNSRAVPQEVAGLNGFKIRHASCGRRCADLPCPTWNPEEQGRGIRPR